MTKYLLAAACLALASCAAQKALPRYTPEQQAAQRGGISWWQPDPAPADRSNGPRVEPSSQADFIRKIFDGHPPVVQQELEVAGDSLHFVKVTPSPQKPTEKRRLFGLLPAKKPSGNQTLGKCKGCTFNVVAGNQTNQQVGKNGQVLGAGASNTKTGKKSGDIIKADSGAIVNKVGGPGNAQATRGNNNASQLSAPVQQALDWRAILAQPAGEVAATALGLVVLAACSYAAWVLIPILKRRKAENQA